MLTAILGIAILSTDNVLRSGAPMHYYALIAFVIVDLIVGTFVFTKGTRVAFLIAIAWSILRIVLQIADLSQASVYQFSSYTQFADYLFNPTSGIAVSLGNPPGVPGMLIDLIIVFELAVIVIAWSSSRSKP